MAAGLKLGARRVDPVWVYHSSGRFLRISAFALACELVIAASTLLPGAPVVPSAFAFVLFPLVFVVHARTVWAAVRASRDIKSGARIRFSDLFDGLPRMAIAVFVAFFVAIWFASGPWITESRGQPTERAGHYYLNDHGDYIPVSYDEYRHAQVLAERTFTLIPSVFFAFGVLMNLPRRRRERQRLPAPGART